MNKTKLINTLIIIGVSIFSIFWLFFGNHEQTLYKNLIIISIIPVLLMPTLVRNLFKIKIEPEVELIYLLFIFFSQFLGGSLNFYSNVLFYDKLIHGISGIMTSFLALIILVKSNSYSKNPLWVNVLFIICVTLSVASFWEFFEFINDNIFGKDAQKVLSTGVSDTMLDMLAAFICSIGFSILYIIEEKLNKNILVKKFINKIS